MLTFCFIIILLSTFTSVATSKSVIKLTDSEDLDDYHLSHIFYLNDFGNLLFIDFDVIEEKLEKVRILKDSRIIKQEDISELPSSTIYELDLTDYKTGNYTVELSTDNKTKIRKEVAIN